MIPKKTERGVPLEVYSVYDPKTPQKNRFSDEWLKKAEMEFYAQDEYETVAEFLRNAKSIPQWLVYHNNFSKKIRGWANKRRQTFQNKQKKLERQVAITTKAIEKHNESALMVQKTNHLLLVQLVTEGLFLTAKEFNEAVKNGDVDFRWTIKNMNGIKELLQIAYAGDKLDQNSSSFIDPETGEKKQNKVILEVVSKKNK